MQAAGVITIPPGHPLYRLIGTKYDDVLNKYLGSFATLRLSGDSQYNAAVLSRVTCTQHAGSQNGGQAVTDPLVRDQLLPDARAGAFRVVDHRELKGVSHFRKMAEMSGMELSL